MNQADLMLRRRLVVPGFRTAKNKISFPSIKYVNTKPLFSCEFSCQLKISVVSYSCTSPSYHISAQSFSTVLFSRRHFFEL